MSPLSTILICSTVFLLFLSSTPMHVHLHFHVSAKLPTPKPRSAMAMGALLNKPPTPKFISALINSNRKTTIDSASKSNQNLVKIADFMKKQQARDLLKHLLAQGYKPVITRVEEAQDHRAHKVKHLCSTKKCTSFLDESLERGNSI